MNPENSNAPVQGEAYDLDTLQPQVDGIQALKNNLQTHQQFGGTKLSKTLSLVQEVLEFRLPQDKTLRDQCMEELLPLVIDRRAVFCNHLEELVILRPTSADNLSQKLAAVDCLGEMLRAFNMVTHSAPDANSLFELSFCAEILKSGHEATPNIDRFTNSLLSIAQKLSGGIDEAIAIAATKWLLYSHVNFNLPACDTFPVLIGECRSPLAKAFFILASEFGKERESSSLLSRIIATPTSQCAAQLLVDEMGSYCNLKHFALRGLSKTESHWDYHPELIKIVGNEEEDSRSRIAALEILCPVYKEQGEERDLRAGFVGTLIELLLDSSAEEKHGAPFCQLAAEFLSELSEPPYDVTGALDTYRMYSGNPECEILFHMALANSPSCLKKLSAYASRLARGKSTTRYPLTTSSDVNIFQSVRSIVEKVFIHADESLLCSSEEAVEAIIYAAKEQGSQKADAIMTELLQSRHDDKLEAYVFNAAKRIQRCEAYLALCSGTTTMNKIKISAQSGGLGLFSGGKILRTNCQRALRLRGSRANADAALL